MRTASGHEVLEVDPKIENYLKENWEGFAKYGVKKVVPGDFYSSDQFPLKIDNLYHFALRPQDIFVCSYLKVGSTWLTEVLWTITNNANLDNPLQHLDVYNKGPWFETEVSLPVSEIPMAMAKSIPQGKTFFDILDNLPNTRVFHTHILFGMLPKDTMEKAKSVYIIRDPRDVCLSFYHYVCNVTFYGYVKPLETFVDDFVDGKVFNGHYIDHLRQWWPHRNNPNVLTVYFEEIRRNPKIEMKKLGEFVGINLTDKQIENVIHYTSIGEMKKRDLLATSEKANKQFLKQSDGTGFFRKGEVGASKSGMTAEMNEKVSKYFRENLGEIKLPYDFSK